MNSIPFQGIIAYPITPFDEQDQVDLPLFRSLLERLIRSGADGIAPLGSTGVLPYLGREEQEAVTEAALQQVNGRVPVLAGVSQLTTCRYDLSCPLCGKSRRCCSNDPAHELLEAQR